MLSDAALECLHDALPGRHESWRVWLRQGECVVAAHVQALKAERRRCKTNLGVEAGSRDKQRILLPTEYTSEGVAHAERGAGPKGRDKDAPAATPSVRRTPVCVRSGVLTAAQLAYGQQCLDNALALLSGPAAAAARLAA